MIQILPYDRIRWIRTQLVVTVHRYVWYIQTVIQRCCITSLTYHKPTGVLLFDVLLRKNQTRQESVWWKNDTYETIREKHMSSQYYIRIILFEYSLYQLHTRFLDILSSFDCFDSQF